MKTLKITFTCILFTLIMNAQKEITSTFLSEKIKIDGELNESIWNIHLENGNFIQSTPNNGKNATQKTRIAVLNDASYFYVVAELYTATTNLGKHKINKKLSERDDNGTSDYFGVIIDPFGVSREGWAFLVTAANVQLDIKVTNTDNYSEWNAVWESAVKIYKDKWTVEIKIPFNSLRFPKGNFENFTLNFERFDSSTNENSFWNHIDENKDGTLNQFGKLKGLTKVNPPINLAFNPFISFVQENPANGKTKTTLSGGLDLKYVYKNAYTLDLSLIPDFSQAPSDDEVFNLTPFEVKFDENRQFFVEGTEIFNKGDYLFTRRIGGEPIHLNNIELNDNEIITKNPVTSNVQNLLKFTGKSEKGLSIGVLNAITKKSEATIFNSETNTSRKVITNPLTNYNAFVLDQTLKNNSSITFINNAVIRNGSDFDANLTAAIVKLYTKKRSYSLTVQKAISQHYFSKIANQKNKFGHQHQISIRKISGSWTGGIVTALQDDKYDNNDFGFNSRNNRLSNLAFVQYAKRDAKKLFSNYNFTVKYFERYYYSLKEKERAVIQLDFFGRTKKNQRIFIEFLFQDKSKDFFEARSKDRVFKEPIITQSFFEYQTNQNKDLSFAGFFELTNYHNSTIYTNAVNVGYGLQYKLGQHLSLAFEQNYEYTPNNVGFLTNVAENIIFGHRKINELTNNLNIDYAVNSKLHFNASIRHFWIQVNYKQQFTLAENGHLLENNLPINVSDSNANFNNFNIDFIAKWQFAPVSELSIAYKLGATYFDRDTNSNYGTNFSQTIKEKSDTTIALKLTYLIDFNKIKLLKKLF